MYPGTADDLCALDHADPFQLLAATILSAQCTDERVNRTTPALFARFPDAYALASADQREVEAIIRSTGFFRAKARNLVGMASVVVERFDGQVPSAMRDLVTLPGVGRKTANVVRSVAFGLAGLPVDTHVQRLSARLGLTEETDPVRVEAALNTMIPAHRARGVQSPDDPPRSRHLHGPAALLRAVRALGLLPIGRHAAIGRWAPTDGWSAPAPAPVHRRWTEPMTGRALPRPPVGRPPGPARPGCAEWPSPPYRHVRRRPDGGLTMV